MLALVEHNVILLLKVKCVLIKRLDELSICFFKEH